jgi:fatty-acyl-CoA synthase
MAAITTEGTLDLEGLRTHLASRLPTYAQPLFLRIEDSIATTATFKHQKSDLVRQGFDPASTTDSIYLNEPSQQAYIRLDDAVFRRIHDAAMRL